MKYKLTLIQPDFDNRTLDRNKGTLPPLGLAYIAAYTPENWDVEIIDEQMEKIDYRKSDLVGISTTTMTANRAYDIAARYRELGCKVVLGGVHASMLPDEAKEHCDCVVIGDAEPVWNSVISDFENGTLKGKYVSTVNPLDNLRSPRTSLFSSKYMFHPVSMSRGCPFNCSFCSINRFYQGKYRLRKPEEVYKDIKAVNGNYIFFTDGNIYGHSRVARENLMTLCKLIKDGREKNELNFKYWMGYGSINFLEDEEALKTAWESGCRALFIGFESINPKSLEEMNKNLNLSHGVEKYKQYIRNAHKQGILIIGEMIVGFDNDTEESWELTRKFIFESEMDLLRLQILQPLPGTELFEELKSQNRLLIGDFPEDWKKFRDNFVMGVHYKLKGKSKFDLQKYVKDTGSRFYSHGQILRRLIRVLSYSKDMSIAPVFLVSGYKSRKTYKGFRLRKDQ